MCYSGKCIWEGHMGDCDFPRIKEVRDKYPLPLCGIGDPDFNQEDYDAKVEDVRRIVAEHIESMKKK